MPRQSRSSRPAARSAPAPAQQTRQASTSAYPASAAPAGHAAQPQVMQQQRQPGMLAGIASTAAGVASGSVIGHGISNM
jgi:hypothetical protein